MAASTPHDLWLCYQQCMDLHRQAHDPHTRNLMLADAQACLGLWFNAVERELRARATPAADAAPQPELSRS
jgi:hypothetical protein